MWSGLNSVPEKLLYMNRKFNFQKIVSSNDLPLISSQFSFNT